MGRHLCAGLSTVIRVLECEQPSVDSNIRESEIGDFMNLGFVVDDENAPRRQLDRRRFGGVVAFSEQERVVFVRIRRHRVRAFERRPVEIESNPIQYVEDGF